MNNGGIIERFKEAGLVGRGGASFPVWQKWQAVKEAEGEKKYIICNASEGEPGVFKDEYILAHHAEDVIEGIQIAQHYLGSAPAIIFLNKKFYKKFKRKLEKLCRCLNITLHKKTEGYIAGEETALLNQIEGKRTEPRSKPPYPTDHGLYGCPTLINNVETFYHVAKIVHGRYNNSWFFSISGKVAKPGVYEFPADISIKNALKESGNYPDFPFFVQLGGWACGEIYLENELDKPRCGCASIIIYDLKKTDPFILMGDWARFYAKNNCDKCTPCREGSMHIAEIVGAKKIDYEKLSDIFFVLEKSSYCSLGRGMAVPFRSLIEKVVKKDERV